tara:strand:+ start:275 stop:514 length:240 start_codon:yes stop_codon:yes gene_type:complete
LKYLGLEKVIIGFVTTLCVSNSCVNPDDIFSIPEFYYPTLCGYEMLLNVVTHPPNMSKYTSRFYFYLILIGDEEKSSTK